MSWFDSVKDVWFHTKAEGAQAGSHIAERFSKLKNVKANVQSWIAERNTEHQQLSAERENANLRAQALKDRTRFPGMSYAQRSAEIKETRNNMPGIAQVAHAHPLGRAITAPFRGGWNLVSSLFKKGASLIAPHITEGSNNTLILLAIVYHLLIIFGGVPTLGFRIILNIILIIIVILGIFNSNERNGDTYRTLFIWVSVFEIFIPLAVQEIAILQKLDFISLYIANGFIVWTWLYYAVFIRGKDIERGLTRWIRMFIILFWIGVAISLLGTSFVDFTDVEIDTASADAWFAAQNVFSKTWDGWALVWNTLVSGVSNVQTIFTMRMKQATGEYYFGVVEENEKEQLGVYIEDLKSSQSEYEENEQVIVYATINAKTLDDTVNVKISCYAGEDQNKILGVVYPAETFTVSNLQQEELDCTFDRLTKGTHKITYTADFNFETIGYLKRYFADRNAIASATRQDIDLLNEYQITDTTPVAHYTNGPVAMGIGPEQVLVGVSDDYTVKPRLAFTLDSTKGWGGVISKLNEVVLLIPEEMSLDTTQCTDKNWVEYNVEDCIESEVRYSSKISQQCYNDEACIEEQCTAQMNEYRAYKLDVDNPSYTNIKDYITLSCRLNVDDVMGLLEATPIATHYFYVKTRYEYQTSEDTSVTVNAAEDRSITIGGSSLKSDSVPSFTLSDKDSEMQFIFYNFGEYLFEAEQEFSIPVCDIAGIIAYPAHSNPNYYDTEKGKKGLMGLTDTLMTQYKSTAGYSDPQPYDPQTNIMIGTAYMQYIYSVATEAETRFMEYYLRVNNIDQYDQDTKNYAAIVQGYVEECKSLGLDAAPASSETGIDNAYQIGSYPVTSLATPVTLFNTNGKPVAISAVISTTQIHKEGISLTDHIVYLYYATIYLNDNIREPLQWTGFESNPFIQVYYASEDDSINYKYFTDFVVNTDPLIEDEDTEIIKDVLYVEYTGSEIIIKLANNPADKTQLTQVCDIPWTQNTAMQTCASTGISDADENLPGLIIRNMITDESVLGTGVAQVQLDWNVARQMEATS